MASYPDLCISALPEEHANVSGFAAYPDAYIRPVNVARTRMLYGFGALVGILLGLATAQVSDSCGGSCTRPHFPYWQDGLIGLACGVAVLVACALLDEEFIPVTRQWLRSLRRRLSGDGRKRQAG
jgi:hypothetical protein